jgi:type II secretory pathway component PulK
MKRSRTQGAILIVAMVVVFAIAALTLTLARTAQSETQVSGNEFAQIQASMIERGAEQWILGVLTEQKSELDQFTDADFAAIPVGDGYFWVLRPDYGDSTLPAFGLVDESSKLNINVASYETLRLLPGMTDEIAASIVDWRDEDDTPTQSGAESAAYQTGRDPYSAKNAPFETVEELLLVRNVTSDLLYGHQSSSRNLMNDIVLQNGWRDYLTIYSGATTTSSDGSAKIDINSTQARNQLRQMLTSKLSATRGNEIAGQITNNMRFLSVFDFANRFKLTTDEFQSIEGSIRVGNSGRINVNTAPRDVLMCLMEQQDVDNLLARRPSATQSNPTSIAWVYDVLKEKSVGLASLIGEGRYYSADVVAVSGNGRAFKHVRVVWDTGASPIRVVYRRDLTDRGFPMDPTILQNLRAGGLSGGVR